MNDTTQTTTETTISSGNTKPKKVFHRKHRTWLICFVVTISLLGIIIPTIYFLITSKIIQDRINDSVLQLSIMNISMPITESSFLLQNKGDLSGSGDAIHSFPDSIDIKWNGTIIGNLKLDDLKLQDGKAHFDQSQTFNITDAQAWVDFIQVLFVSEEFTWTLEGKTVVRVLGIVRCGFDFRKDIKIRGGQGFNNVNVTNYTISNITLANGTSTVGQVINVNLHSPSDLTIFVGSLGINIYYEEQYIGLVQTDQQTIYPGDNNIGLQGPLAFNISTIPYLVIYDLWSKYLRDENITVNIRGAFAKPDGINEVSWLSSGIKLLNFNETMKLSPSKILDNLMEYIH